MTIEAAQTINELNTSYPRATDLLREGDDHIRMVKATLQRTFPRITGAVNITSTTLNNLATFLTTTTNSMKVSGTIIADDISSTNNITAAGTVYGKYVTVNSGSLNLGGANNAVLTMGVSTTDNTAIIVNRATINKWDWNNTDLHNIGYMRVNGITDARSSVIARLTNDPAANTGDYLNCPEFRSGFRARGNQTGVTDYGYVSLYAQEHVGSQFSGIIQVTGFNSNNAWRFNQGGQFETGSLKVNGQVQMGDLVQNLTVKWGGNGHTYQENGDIVRIAGNNSIFPSFGSSNGTLSGALTWMRDNINNNINNINDRVNNVRTVNRRGVSQGDVGAFICGVGDFGANDGYGWACDMQIWKNNTGGWQYIAWN